MEEADTRGVGRRVSQLRGDPPGTGAQGTSRARGSYDDSCRGEWAYDRSQYRRRVEPGGQSEPVP